MGKVSLITCEGFGNQGIPRVAGTDRHVETGAVVPGSRDIMAVVRHFDASDGDHIQRSPHVDPVIRYERINELLGKILTIVDASTPDAAQRKAQKDLFKQAVWSWYESQTEGLSANAPGPDAG